MEAGWEARLWTDSNIAAFALAQSRDVRDLMRAYPSGIMRSDAFRYLILRQLGGLYVDLDFVNLSNLEWIAEIDQFACADQGDGQLCNALMWAPRPEDPFFEGIEESLLSKAEKQNPVSATGPRFLTAHSAGKSFQQIPREWIYPVAWDDAAEISQARSLGPEGLRRRYPQARAIHIWSKSWFTQCGVSDLPAPGSQAFVV